MQLLREVLARFGPQPPRLHRQCVVQIMYQLEQALDVGFDHARAVGQVRLRKKIGVDPEFDLERTAQRGVVARVGKCDYWGSRDVERSDIAAGALVELGTKTAQRHARRSELPFAPGLF